MKTPETKPKTKAGTQKKTLTLTNIKTIRVLRNHQMTRHSNRSGVCPYRAITALDANT
jgi:hypothetical protein